LAADCRVVYRTPKTTAGGQIVYEESAPLPMCDPYATSANTATDCWQLTIDKNKCPEPSQMGQLIRVLRTQAEIAAGPLTEGTKIGMSCWTCPDLTSAPGCLY
jgi:hypothetical protein